MADMIIQGGHLVVPHGDDRVRVIQGDLALSDDLIVGVGGEGALPSDYDPETIDAAGCAVMPGLVNAHGHGAMTLLRGYADDMPLMTWLEDWVWPAEAHLADEDVYWGTALACLEMLKGGTTTFADMYFHMDRAAAAVRDLGMRGTLSLGLVGVSPRAEEDLELSLEFAREYHGAADGRIQVQLGPHAPYTCPPAYMERVSNLASELGLGIHIHLAETQAEMDDVHSTYGVTPVEYARDCGLMEHHPFLAAHCVHVDEGDIALLRDSGAGVAHCTRSNQKLGSGIAPLKDMLDGGVLVGIGTDGACSTGTLDMWAELRAASLVQKGVRLDAQVIPASRILHMATRGGALALGLEDTGSLLPGMKADVIIVDLDGPHLTPQHDVLSLLAYAAGPGDVRDVFVDGRQVIAQGRLETADEKQIIRENRERAGRLVERVRGS